MPWGIEDKKAKEEKPVEKTITDYETLIKEFERLRDMHQKEINEDILKIGSWVQELKGDPRNIDEQGKIGELRDYIKKMGFGRTKFGMETNYILILIEDLSNFYSSYSERMQEYITGFRVIGKSACLMLNNAYNQMEKIKEDISYKRKEYEEELEILRESPTKVKIEPGEELPEIRKRELEEIFNNCGTQLDFINLVNPKRRGKEFTGREILYLKGLNATAQRWFKKKKPTETVESLENTEKDSQTRKDTENSVFSDVLEPEKEE